MAQGRATLEGHVHPQVLAGTDLGRVDASLTMTHVSVFLKKTPAQQADLESFLVQLQDPTSLHYHQWLTPEQYANRFSPSQADVDTVTAWLKSRNMQSVDGARGRNSVSFTGNVRDIERAFAIEIHRYNVRGETHFANASDPSVPESLAGLIGSVRGLTDFRLKPRVRAKGPAVKPNYTSGFSGNMFVGPDDMATIYDAQPLIASGINGTGMKVAVAGQTDIIMSDIESYRAFFNLPPNDPQVVLVTGSADPGVSTTGDLLEADLDIELAGSMARNATVVYVNSQDAFTSAYYAINQNLAPVLTVSYGDCEANWTNGDLNALRTMAQQAAAQGISWFAAAGDSGAADCYTGSGHGNTNAMLAVDVPAAVPEITGMGGSEFNEGGGSYWAASNNANHASAFSYIPEMVWNDSTVDGAPSAGGGGASTLYPKPVWQTGSGVPSDGARDVPDISLPSSDAHDDIYVYSSDSEPGGALQPVGGTSCAAPTMASMTALLNQYVASQGGKVGQGNLNPRLYQVAALGGAIHDITVGSNIVDGCIGVRNCTVGSVGYNAGAGYDQASGLGSIDLYNLALAWPTSVAASKNAVTLTLASSAATVISNGSVTVTATLASSGGGAPTGTVAFFAGGVSLGSVVAVSGGAAAMTVNGSSLPAGANVVEVSTEYSGDATHAGAGASLSLSVTSVSAMTITGIVNAASGGGGFSPGMIASVYGTLLAGSTAVAPTVPLPVSLAGVSVTVNGTPAPLYFVSPGQLNIQIPYAVTVNPDGFAVSVPVVVTYNGNTVTADIPVAESSPGIFVDYNQPSPYPPVGLQTARRGQTVAIYVTGAGAVSPAVVAGAPPSGNTTPVPTNPVTITVGSVAASTAYAYIGVPVWAIGLIQVNFTIPSAAPLGSQAVQVNINGAVSQNAYVLITQ